MAPFTHVVKLLDLLSLTHSECFSCFKNGFLHLYVHNLLSCSHRFIPHSKIPSFQNPLKALFLVKGNQTNIQEKVYPLCTILFTAFSDAQKKPANKNRYLKGIQKMKVNSPIRSPIILGRDCGMTTRALAEDLTAVSGDLQLIHNKYTKVQHFTV